MHTHRVDVVVIGGGPAGMMAAGRAAELGATVLLLEKNPSLGKKLLITGGGRCNILHAEFDRHRLVEKYGKKGKVLFSAFAQFDAEDTRAFFQSRGLPIKIEAEQRAFPVSDKAEDVQKVLMQYMKKHQVQIKTNARVQVLETKDAMVSSITMHDGSSVTADRYILATGGKSRPETGSTGDGFLWAKSLGHTVSEPTAALVPLALKDVWVPALAGISFKDVKVSVTQNSIQKISKIGKILFTHVGISGPLVLNMSKEIGVLLETGEVTLSLDLFPSMDSGALDQYLLQHFGQSKNKQIKNNIGGIVPPKLGHAVLALAKIPPETPLHQLTRDQRLAFASLLKALPLHVAGLLGAEKAIVTGGGVDLREIDFHTMRSRLYQNLFFAGDILDFDRPSGGFSLQICWTTGFVAGSHAAGERL